MYDYRVYLHIILGCLIGGLFSYTIKRYCFYESQFYNGYNLKLFYPQKCIKTINEFIEYKNLKREYYCKYALLSIDYAISHCFKYNIKNSCNNLLIKSKYKIDNKKPLGDYIRFSNKANFWVSLLHLIIAVIVLTPETNTMLKCIAFGMLILRLWSRVNEVSLAFVNDIGESKNQSGLTSGQRLKLAIVSLAEEAILFGALYGIIACCGKWNADEFIYGALHGAYSIVPNINIGKSVAWNVLSVFQCVSAMILISLAIASYLSNRKGNNVSNE